MRSRIESINNLPAWFKAAVVTIEISIAGSLALSLYLAWNRVTFIADELRGVEQASPLNSTLHDLGLYRSACTGAAVSTNSELSSLCVETLQNLERRSDEHEYELTSVLTAREYSPRYFYEQQTHHNLDHLARIYRLYGDSKVQLDPESLTFALGKIYFDNYPTLIETLGQLRSLLFVAIDDSSVAPLIHQTIGLIRERVRIQNNDLRLLENSNGPMFDDDFVSVDEEVEDFLRQSELVARLIGWPSQKGSVHALFDRGIQLVERIEALNTQVGRELQQLFIISHQKASGILYSILLLGIAIQGAVLFVIGLYIRMQNARESAEYQSEKLNQLLSSQEKIFATVGHEIRTPAATIDMLIDLNFQEQQSERSRELKELSTHLLSILDDMKMATNQGFITETTSIRTHVSVDDTIRRAMAGLELLASENNVRLSYKPSGDISKVHWGSPKGIFQVVQNLVKNSILHSGGSEITLLISARELNHVSTHFLISVVDNGAGIPEEFRDRMFEPFERGKTKSQGNGLGLYICREIAMNLPDGNLEYHQNDEGGSVFEFAFTLDIAEEQIPDTQTDLFTIQGKRILFVEDTKMLRMLGRKLLENQGAEVSEAANGREALELISRVQPDIVLTDIMMPEMDGYELTESLRNSGFTGPIIGITAATVGVEAERLLAYGADGVLAKPLSMSSLQETLKIHARRQA